MDSITMNQMNINRYIIEERLQCDQLACMLVDRWPDCLHFEVGYHCAHINILDGDSAIIHNANKQTVHLHFKKLASDRIPYVQLYGPKTFFDISEE